MALDSCLFWAVFQLHASRTNIALNQIIVDTHCTVGLPACLSATGEGEGTIAVLHLRRKSKTGQRKTANTLFRRKKITVQMYVHFCAGVFRQCATWFFSNWGIEIGSETLYFLSLSAAQSSNTFSSFEASVTGSLKNSMMFLHTSLGFSRFTACPAFFMTTNREFPSRCLPIWQVIGIIIIVSMIVLVSKLIN